MNCEQARLQIQALLDNEIGEDQVAPLLSHLESCYSCRSEYISFLKLTKKLKGLSIPEPAAEWFETLPKKIVYRSSKLLGKILFFGSYALLLGYALYSILSDKSTDAILKVGIGGIVLGFAVLLGVTVAGRIRESRDDRYKGVMK